MQNGTLKCLQEGYDTELSDNRKVKIVDISGNIDYTTIEKALDEAQKSDLLISEGSCRIMDCHLSSSGRAAAYVACEALRFLYHGL